MKIKHCFEFIIVTFMIILGCIFWGKALTPRSTTGNICAVDAFHLLPENSIEVIGYGSSHIFKGLDCKEMYNNYGIGIYNYGNNWQSIDTTKLFIEDSLRTQSPKIILIETYNINKTHQVGVLDGELLSTYSIPIFSQKSKFVSKQLNNNPENVFGYYIPLFAVHDTWSNMKESSLYCPVSTQKTLKEMGFRRYKDSKKVKLGDYTSKSLPLKKESIKILDSIVKICKEKNIQIIFYTAPMGHEYYYCNSIKKYAAQNGCEYINFFELYDEVGFDGSKDFMDKGHLNSNGAKKIANYLGKYIAENYSVTDFRKVENNIWEQNFQ